MAKRIRGSRSSHRPGGVGPSAAAPRSAPPRTAGASATFTPSPASADAVASSSNATAAVAPVPGPNVHADTSARVSRSTPGRLKVKPDSLLAARAATEYRYVDQDLRRIAVVAAGLLVALLVLWVLLVPMDLLGIY